MGVSNSLPYDLEEEVPFTSPLHWQLFHGKKKDDDPSVTKEQVSIYKFLKNQTVNISLPQRGIQRLRTMKHPYVLSFVASSEMEDSLLIVTEYGLPLETWIKNFTLAPLTDSEKESLIMEILWGLKCILDACNFLHMTCRISHCMISPQSCFVTKNGDWKLGFMDLACDISVDTDYFRLNESILTTAYRSPERVDGSWSDKYNRSQSDQTSSQSLPSLGSAVDIYSLGKVIQFVFDTLKFLEMPQCLSSPLKRMLSPDCKRRPTCSSLLRLPCFESDQLALMTSISELQLKPTSECLEVFKVIKQKADVISRAACTFKILPSIGHSLNQAVNDFQNRDLRELSRQTVQASLDLLACFGAQHKVEESPFQASCLVPIQNLWTISDRSIRTSLLKTLKQVVTFLPKDVVNKKVFEPLIGGFSDSNAKLREETLKSLVYVIDKLEENQLQDKLVRCISNLQQDPENSIRTNATIFMSRIMPKLKDSVRAKVLVAAYTKAMKDPFSHCRIAGLRATDACLSPVCLVDVQQLCSRLMPQVCLLLVDKSSDVRELALNVLTSCIDIVKSYHKDNKKTSSGEETLTSTVNSPPPSSSSQSSNNQGWASWTVDGLSKSIEKVALTATSPQFAEGGEGSSLRQESTCRKDEWGDVDIDFEDEDNIPPKTQRQWEDIPTTVKTSSKKDKSKTSDSYFDDWDKTSSPNLGSSSTKVGKSKEKAPPSIKKMDAPTHSDFDDWDDPPEAPSVRAKDLPKGTTAKIEDEFDEWGDELDSIELPPGEAWGDEDDLDLDMNVLGNTSSPVIEKKVTTSLSSSSLSKSHHDPSPKASSVAASTTKSTKVTSSKRDSSNKEIQKKSFKTAPVVKKLAVSSTETDNWDDF